MHVLDMYVFVRMCVHVRTIKRLLMVLHRVDRCMLLIILDSKFGF